MNPQTEKRGLFNLRLLIFLGTILFLIIAIAYFFYGLQPVNLARIASEQPVQFKITKGDGFREIGARLSQESLVRSIFVFKLYSFFSGKVQKFQPGVYQLFSSMGVPQIVETLTAGGQNEVTVTIPEGVTAKDIDQILLSSGAAQTSILNYSWRLLAGDFPFLADRDSLEGFLFPDTYQFAYNSSPETILRTILGNFETKVWPMLVDAKDWYGSLILASILEREVPSFEDRQIVAGILLKRMRLGMPLQVDSSISYAKCDGQFKDCPNIKTLRVDLKIPSLYNTYLHLGLTPTPIANSGQAAVQAALTPRASNYLYYLSSSKNGATIYSRTLEEHNTKKAIYL